MLTDEIALALSVYPGQVDCALAFNIPDHLQHRIFRRNRNHHVDMIGHQMPFFNPTFLLCGQSAEQLTKMPTQFHIKRTGLRRPRRCRAAEAEPALPPPNTRMSATVD